ncbi:SDR family NAD(P)-dependent oxidoreductase [Streptomyces lichenis]|nr:glucose 1-dehydrogenase [Streptomyces lichenis]
MGVGYMRYDGGLLAGRTAMVTGASSGIGSAAARLFAEEGAAVVLMARRKERLEGLAEEIGAAGGRVAWVAGDVTDPEDVRRTVRTAVERFGGLDAAFNNAGQAAAGGDLHLTDDAVYEQVMDANVRGVWNCLRAQVPVMLEGGGGSIVNTSSVAGLLATGACASYVAAKHAVIGLTKAAAAQYGERGIRVNALVVGNTRTEMLEGVLAQAPELEEQFLLRPVQKRLAAPREIAETAAWLCSDRSRFTTGASVQVDGGWTAV